MKKTVKTVQSTCSLLLLAGAQATVFVAVMASQMGERILRGPRGFAVYRQTFTG